MQELAVGIASSKHRRFLGSGIIYSPSKILTCAHVIEGCDEKDLQIFVNPRTDDQQGNLVEVSKVSKHDKYDFAIISVSDRLPFFEKKYYLEKIKIGTDYQLVGYTFLITGASIDVEPRCLKGNIVRTSSHNTSLNSKIKSLVEISTAIPSGMSGSPVFTTSMELLGMTVGNNQHSTELSLHEVENEGEYKVEKYIIEQFGLIHPAHDILDFIKDLEE